MSEKKNDLPQQIKNVYTLISSLSVSGDAIDVIAQVRLLLRQILKEVGENAGS